MIHTHTHSHTHQVNFEWMPEWTVIWLSYSHSYTFTKSGSSNISKILTTTMKHTHTKAKQMIYLKQKTQLGIFYLSGSPVTLKCFKVNKLLCRLKFKGSQRVKFEQSTINSFWRKPTFSLFFIFPCNISPLISLILTHWFPLSHKPTFFPYDISLLKPTLSSVPLPCTQIMYR